ncbi:hypothetical protein G1K75_11975 [Tenacibaculum finnmarkense]|uniref:hypothetical protein n=1 Tax=Tenacibaculum finnmarkense TaxID=2781243 RepID=UPI00187BA612|nr:hypothetical protein [Tenacibaculum finnmarkense]MBE7649134.1 hypothetical protein [Tenacibaculum finnmarkense genomovar ulcerans]MCG8806368.1 hypothetical protein [Tenacibaculum finnmarkense]MCG8857494.1 hypothetical protein [Tenacibaculum finnmarkense]
MAGKQNKIVASFSSAKGNSLDIIFPDEEIKGTGPRFVNVSFAQRVAASLNTIFKKKFKITYNVFCAEELIITKPLNLRPEVTNIFNLENAFLNDAITEADIFFSLNKSFAWGQDSVTKAFYEFHTEKLAYRTNIININNDEVLQLNGGFIHNRSTIFLYDKNYNDVKEVKGTLFFKDEGGDSKYTLGGVYIHELMYHNYPDDFGEGDPNTNYLRDYFLLESNTGSFVDSHYKGKNQRDKQFWIDVRNKNLKGIWNKNK